MDDGLEIGAAYLASLRRSGEPSGAGTAPALDTTPLVFSGSAPEQSPTTEFRGMERRRSPRYPCEGSIEIREEGSDVRSWSSFTDVSLHGCYIEAPVTHPVGTTLDLKLRAHGFQIETEGCVKVCYPSLAMGIAFGEMTVESRHQLQNLVNFLRSNVRVIEAANGASTSEAPNLRTPNSPAFPQVPVGDTDSAPIINNAGVALSALFKFFEGRQLLMRDEFWKIVRKSQGE